MKETILSRRTLSNAVIQIALELFLCFSFGFRSSNVRVVLAEDVRDRVLGRQIQLVSGDLGTTTGFRAQQTSCFVKMQASDLQVLFANLDHLLAALTSVSSRAVCAHELPVPPRCSLALQLGFAPRAAETRCVVLDIADGQVLPFDGLTAAPTRVFHFCDTGCRG
jgi:hypothetical protein